MEFYSNDNELCVLPSSFKSFLLDELKEEYEDIPKIVKFNKDEFDIFLEYWKNIPSIEIYNIVAIVSSYLIIEMLDNLCLYKPYQYIDQVLIKENTDKFNNCYKIPMYFKSDYSSYNFEQQFAQEIVKDENYEYIKIKINNLKKSNTLKYWCTSIFWDISSILGNLNFIKLLHENNLTKYIKIKYDCLGGPKDKIKCSLNSNQVMNNAATNGHLKIIQWLYNKQSSCVCTTRSINGAAANGHFHIVEWLKENKNLDCTDNAMNWAAQECNLNALKWLHEKEYNCTVDAMNSAAENGYLEIVEWLHNNREEGCTHRAMDMAVYGNHFEMVEWLHNNREEGCTYRAMNIAAYNCNFDILNFLHNNRGEGCTQVAMNHAAKMGRFEVVKWLHNNRTEGNLTEAIERAKKTDNHNIVKWLEERI